MLLNPFSILYRDVGPPKKLSGHLEFNSVLKEPVLGKLESIKWIVITSENAEEVFKKLEEEGIDPVLFGLTDNDYQLIAKNFAQIRHNLKTKSEIIKSYKDYYEKKSKEEK